MNRIRLSVGGGVFMVLFVALGCGSDATKTGKSAHEGDLDASAEPGARSDGGKNQHPVDASKAGNGETRDAGGTADSAAPGAPRTDASTLLTDSGTLPPAEDAASPTLSVDAGGPTPASLLPSCTQSAGGFGCVPPSTVWTCQSAPTKPEEKVLKRNCRGLATGLIRYCCDF
ncbi:MAG: hypothetical protein RJA70_2682 [Pseudomonadota bacterium]|jgi:hypothetical protein